MLEDDAFSSEGVKVWSMRLGLTVVARCTVVAYVSVPIVVRENEHDVRQRRGRGGGGTGGEERKGAEHHGAEHRQGVERRAALGARVGHGALPGQAGAMDTARSAAAVCGWLEELADAFLNLVDLN